MRHQFIITQTDACIGCLSCELACAAAHANISFEEAYTTLLPLLSRNRVIQHHGKMAPLQCMHCETPSCMAICPHGVISLEEGFVKLDETACVGCGCCALACPYGAIAMVKEDERVYALKCNLCFERDNNPACVEHCPTQALSLMDYAHFEGFHA